MTSHCAWCAPYAALVLVWLPTTTISDGHTCHVTARPAVAKRGPKKTGRKPGRPAVKKAGTAPAKKGAAMSPTAAAQTAPAQAADPQKLNEARDSTADVQLEVVGTGVISMDMQPDSITSVSHCVRC